MKVTKVKTYEWRPHYGAAIHMFLPNTYVFTLAGHFLIYIPLIVIISEGAQKTLFDLNSLFANFESTLSETVHL